MLAILSILGGVALILFGVRFLRKGLNRLVGPRLQVWVARLTGGAFRASGVGLVMGVLAPSTSTHGLLTVSFIKQGLIGVRRAIVLIMGAYVGATMLVHIVALDIAIYAPVGLLVGVMGYMGSRRTGVRGAGQVVMALCFVLMGVDIIADASAPATRSEDLRELVELASGYPWMTVVIAMVVTSVLQSSTAALALVIGVAFNNGGVVTHEFLVTYIAGVNVGVALISLVAGWGEVPSRRFSVAVLACRVVLAIVLVRWMGAWIGGADELPGTLAQRIAIGHTLFNVAALAVALVVAVPLEWVVMRLIPEASGEDGEVRPRAIDPKWADDPHMAFAQTKREIGLAIRMVSQAMRDAWRALESRDQVALREIRQRDDAIDAIERHVKRFLTRQLTDELGPEEVQRRLMQLRFVGDLEAIADVIDKRICDAGIRATQRGVRFSDSGWEELHELYDATCEMLDLSGATFMDESAELAKRLLAMKDEIRDTELQMRERHYERLASGLQESFDTTGLHLELMSQLKHIAHVAAGVAYSVEQLGEVE
ncbi:MAG: Na/Pi cotransporter family protein [Phycisphaerales bacterium JB043]